jgi:hypothetical protein
VPLAIGFGYGAELRQPLGISIIGGLVLSQLLTLYTTPVVYLALDRLRLRFAREACGTGRGMKAWPTILIAILAGCTMGPDYRRPETPAVEAFRETPEPWKVAQPRDDLERGRWWEVFGDPQLNDLITKIDVSNQTLAASEAQFRQTLAALGISRAALFPTLDANATVVRSPLSRQHARGHHRRPHRDQLRRAVHRAMGNRSVGPGAPERRGRRGRGAGERRRRRRGAPFAPGAARHKLLPAALPRCPGAAPRRHRRCAAKSLELTETAIAPASWRASDVVQADAQLKSTLVQTVDLGVQRAQLEHAIAVLTGARTVRARARRFAVVRHRRPAIPPGCLRRFSSAVPTWRPPSAACTHRTRRSAWRRRRISRRSRSRAS